MVKCDVDGGIVSDPTGLGISEGGFSIHSAIHMGNAGAVCVMHAHRGHAGSSELSQGASAARPALR